jgi:DNA-binding MarR family transcriptional regulator
MATSHGDERSIFGLGYFLSTLGYRSHAIWAERLVPLGLDSRQAAMLLHVAGAEGRSQQALAQAMKIPPSRVVTLVDALERRLLLRRHADPSDRRVRTLHLTEEGRAMVRRLAAVSAEHEEELSAGLDPGEREQLVALLAKVASGLELSLTVHAGMAGPDWESD